MDTVRPWTLSYTGRIADEHFMHSDEVAYSMLGSSKVSTSVIHYIFNGAVPRGNYAKVWQCLSRPPAQGSYEVEQLITQGVLYSGAALQSPAIFQMAVEHYFEWVISAIKTILTGSNINHENEMERYRESNSHNQEMMRIFAESVDMQQRTHAETVERFLAHQSENIRQLAQVNKTQMTNYVTPIGSSCNFITNNYYASEDELPRTLQFDKADAEAIRSTEPDEVGDSQEYNCIEVYGLDREKGTCHLKVEGFADDVKGDISDPALKQPNNPYSSALDNQSSLVVIAKPLIRAGEVFKLHISDSND